MQCIFMTTSSFFDLFFLLDRYDREVTFNFFFQKFCEHHHLSVKVHRYWISAGINTLEVISSSLERSRIVEKEKNFENFFPAYAHSVDAL